MYLDYAGIRVTNLTKAARFVTKGLGLREVRRGTMGHGGVWVLYQDPASGQRLELNWYPKGNKFAVPFVGARDSITSAFESTTSRRRPAK